LKKFDKELIHELQKESLFCLFNQDFWKDINLTFFNEHSLKIKLKYEINDSSKNFIFVLKK
jgi:hypothetical protein